MAYFSCQNKFIVNNYVTYNQLHDNLQKIYKKYIYSKNEYEQYSNQYLNLPTQFKRNEYVQRLIFLHNEVEKNECEYKRWQQICYDFPINTLNDNSQEHLETLNMNENYKVDEYVKNTKDNVSVTSEQYENKRKTYDSLSEYDYDLMLFSKYDISEVEELITQADNFIKELEPDVFVQANDNGNDNYEEINEDKENDDYDKSFPKL
jgi:hypothetical protein